MALKRRVIFVAGTGTDIGKTHVAACVVDALRREGRRVLGIKPIETGVAVGVGADGNRLHEAACEPARFPSHTFKMAVSPHLAARQEGRTLDVSCIARDIAEFIAKSGVENAVVESAGGFFSPLSESTTNADLAQELAKLTAVELLLVAPNRIGVLHDVGATLLAARARRHEFRAIALSDPPSPDGSSDSNGTELERLHRLAVVPFPHAAPSMRESCEAADKVLRALRVLSQ